MALALLSAAATLAASSSPSCLIVRDAASAQDVKIEAHGHNAVRVRAVASGGAFQDPPDVITALTMINSFSDADCESAALTTAGQSVTSGNLKASVGSDGKLTFTRVSDSKVLLAEKSVRAMQPTTTTPSVPGFSSSAMEMYHQHVPDGTRQRKSVKSVPRSERIVNFGTLSNFPSLV